MTFIHTYMQDAQKSMITLNLRNKRSLISWKSLINTHIVPRNILLSQPFLFLLLLALASLLSDGGTIFSILLPDDPRSKFLFRFLLDSGVTSLCLRSLRLSSVFSECGTVCVKCGSMPSDLCCGTKTDAVNKLSGKGGHLGKDSCKFWGGREYRRLAIGERTCIPDSSRLPVT